MVGVAGRLARPGVRRAGCFEASSAQNDRMRMGSGYALSAGECTSARAHEWWHSQCSFCVDESDELSLRGEGMATARVAVPMGVATKRPRCQGRGRRPRLGC